MGLIKKIKNSIKKKLATMLVEDIRSMLTRNEKKQMIPFQRFKSFGKDSFFWGEEHFVSGFEEISIGQNVHINNNCYIKGEGGLTIGDNTHISRNLVLYSINHDYKGDLIPYDDNMIKREVIIGENVWIGMNVCITPGTKIGDGCIIGMGTVVSGEVPSLSIIGSEKWKKIGERDDAHYNELVKNNLFGGINGKMYNWSNDEIINNEGDEYLSKRSKSEVLFSGGEQLVKKTFFSTKKSIRSFESELEGYKLFKEFHWCPELKEVGDNFLITEYIPNSLRLDQLNLDAFDKSAILKDIIWVLVDIFNSGYAHRDFHTKNIFLTPKGIKITDFETLSKIDRNIDFFNSYDIIGKGLESPNSTDGMCFFHKSEFSLSKKFRIKNIPELKVLVNQKFEEEALSTSKTFHSNLRNNNRAVLVHEKIYSSFDLKNFKISKDKSQRYSKSRLENFNIKIEDIRGKRILDIGSNIGGILLGIQKFEPLESLGLEIDYEKVLFSNKLAKFNNISNIEFQHQNIEDLVGLDFHNEKFEVVFCLAVLEHLKDKDKLFKILSEACIGTLYLEGNAGTDIDNVERRLKAKGFREITYLGFSSDEDFEKNNIRPMWIAKKRKFEKNI